MGRSAISTYYAATHLQLTLFQLKKSGFFELKIGTTVSLLLYCSTFNVHTRFGFSPAFVSSNERVRDRRTDGRTDGRTRPVMQSIKDGRIINTQTRVRRSFNYQLFFKIISPWVYNGDPRSADRQQLDVEDASLL